jgi:DNA-binding SARP family transcriptional activator
MQPTIATGSVRGAPRRSRPPAGSSLERLAFDGFPYALLVLDRAGRVLTRNALAVRLIEAAGLNEGELGCCRLLGCRRPGSVLADACVTELVLDRGAPLPELRVDMATSTGPTAMWVAAGPITGEADRVVLQLRPGMAADRRRRTDPHWIAGPRLTIAALGPTSVASGEGSIGGAWLEQRTGQLLKYLVAERHRTVTVDEIGEGIWPGSEYAVAASVRYYVHALRRRLEPCRAAREESAFIVVRAGAYGLRLDRVDVDADEFESRARSALAKLPRDPDAAAEELERALELYRGDFLADLPYADWALAERGRLHELACTSLTALADLRLAGERLACAAGWLEQLATLQPYDEGVHRRLMELDIARGRRSDAVRRYAALRSRIRGTFGHDPDFTPADLCRTPTGLD